MKYFVHGSLIERFFVKFEPEKFRKNLLGLTFDQKLMVQLSFNEFFICFFKFSIDAKGISIVPVDDGCDNGCTIWETDMK